jgi:hypothetical protein
VNRAADIQRYVFESFIRDDGKVDVYVGTYTDGCILPEGLQPVELLNVWLDGAIPIRDLHSDEDGWSATLSFNRTPFHCYVPWEAVQGVRNAQPTDGKYLTLIYEVDRRESTKEVRDDDTGPQLRVVKGGDAS